MRGSDKNTRDGRVRVSYVDDAEIIERIEEMAKKRRLKVSLYFSMTKVSKSEETDRRSRLARALAAAVTSSSIDRVSLVQFFCFRFHVGGLVGLCSWSGDAITYV
jgi:hypothetical protein